MDLALLETHLADSGQPAYRARQVWEWAARGATGYDAMSNVPAALRDGLRANVPFSTLTVTEEQQAKDGTVKTLFRTHDGHPVEAVLMRYRDGRRSICVSSQSGCPLTCTFCATGTMQFGRNLTTSEILDQALHFRRLEEIDRGRAPKPRDTIRPSDGGGASPLTNCVFMGMGEPLMNFDNVIAAARRLPDVGLTPRRTTISTVGWLPGLTRFIDEVEEPIRIALSLHAANPSLRSQLMPVNDRYPLADVLAELHRYYELRHRRVYRRRVVTRCDRLLQARTRSRTNPGHGTAHARPRYCRCVWPARGCPLGLLQAPAAWTSSGRDGAGVVEVCADRHEPPGRRTRLPELVVHAPAASLTGEREGARVAAADADVPERAARYRFIGILVVAQPLAAPTAQLPGEGDGARVRGLGVDLSEAP